jgi:hypothetical protein
MTTETKGDCKRLSSSLPSELLAATDKTSTKVAAEKSSERKDAGTDAGSIAERILKRTLAPRLEAVQRDLLKIVTWATQHTEIVDGWCWEFLSPQEVERYHCVHAQNLLSRCLKLELERGGTAKCKLKWIALTTVGVDYAAIDQQPPVIKFLRNFGAMDPYPTRSYVSGYELVFEIDSS